MVYILSVFYLFKSRSESILIVYQTWDIPFLLPKFHTVCNRPKKDENNNDDNDNNINNNKINYNNNNNIINGNDNNSNHNSNNNSSNSNDKANKKVCI